MSDKGLRNLIVDVIKEAEDWDETGLRKSTKISREVIKRAKLKGFDVSPYAVVGELSPLWDIENGRRRG